MVKILGIVLVVFGLIALVYGGVGFVTKDKVVDLGPVEISKEKKHSLPVGPIAGTAALLAGGAMLMIGRR